jgi:enolase
MSLLYFLEVANQAKFLKYLTLLLFFIFRLAKYNQLLRIEEELGANAKFAGENFRRPL